MYSIYQPTKLKYRTNTTSDDGGKKCLVSPYLSYINFLAWENKERAICTVT